ncbi:TadE/TadG family type IV pilus assembly protein [Aquamicrobium soli]|jgi:Flp pilus assembly protein TadG|uniref:TadE/TadG family type IV pilus assembly protein n=1 Tax=Aquamicrobium soli TaxID=1811518 RepID=A0ABV7KEG2_9HYPH
MLSGAGARRKIAHFWGRTIRFARDRRGVAAIEFAFLAPVLLGMYFVTMEISQAIETNKKVSRVASMVADLVTQRNSIAPAEIQAIMNIGSSTLQPYNRSVPKITVAELKIGALTAQQVTNGDKPPVTVVWSRKLDANGFGAGVGDGVAVGTNAALPGSLRIPNTSDAYLIRVQTELSYRPMITWAASGKEAAGLSAAFDSIAMSETYYLKARMSQRVDCPAC